MTLYSIFTANPVVKVEMTLLVATPWQVSCIKGPPVLMTRSNWSFDEAFWRSSMSRTWSAPKLDQLSWVYLGERQDTWQPQLKRFFQSISRLMIAKHNYYLASCRANISVGLSPPQMSILLRVLAFLWGINSPWVTRISQTYMRV